MKITILDCPDDAEEEIVIRCKSMDESLLRLIQALKTGRDKITLYDEERLFQAAPGDIYYFEAVDNKVFAYMEKQVYETKMKLYELEEMFQNTDFLRTSKSAIINLTKVATLSPSFNGRFEAVLQNGERLMITRQYVPELKCKLGLKG